MSRIDVLQKIYIANRASIEFSSTKVKETHVRPVFAEALTIVITEKSLI